MNLLEHYIVEIISEQKIQNPENGRGYYRVNASCNNDKSIFKACLETATGCQEFELREESEDKDADSN